MGYGWASPVKHVDRDKSGGVSCHLLSLSLQWTVTTGTGYLHGSRVGSRE